MANKDESKHDAFLRLMQRRLERSKHELRLVSQLHTRNYEYTPEEAAEVVRILDEDVRYIAEVFGVEYATRIGKSASRGANGAAPIVGGFRKVSILDEIAIIQILEDLRAGKLSEVESALRAACTGTGKRAA